MTHAASLADWFAFLSLGVSVHAALSVPYFLLVEAEPADFDPRPAVRRALESGRLDRLLIVVGPAKADAREAAAEIRVLAGVAARLSLLSARDAAALLSPALEVTL